MHDTFGRFFAHFLQPAFVDVLQQGVCREVGIGLNGGAVEADAHAVQGLALGQHAGHTYLKVRELGPGVNQCVFQVRVVVGLLAVVAACVDGSQVTGLAVLVCRVGAAGDRAGQGQAELFALHFIHRDDVDAIQELAGLLHGVFQLLLDAGSDSKGFVGVACVDAVELGHTAEKFVIALAAFVAHEWFLEVGRNRWRVRSRFAAGRCRHWPRGGGWGLRCCPLRRTAA